MTVTALPPTINLNPSNQTATAGQPTTFSAAANVVPAAAVQWQVSTNGGSSFSNVSGATSATLTVGSTVGDAKRLRIRGDLQQLRGHGDDTSAATLTVDYAPTVSVNPASQTVTAGQAATFSAAASANPAATVQWQVSSDGGSTFSNVSGAASATLTVSQHAGRAKRLRIRSALHQLGGHGDEQRRHADGGLRPDGERQPEQPDGDGRAGGDLHARRPPPTRRRRCSGW